MLSPQTLGKGEITRNALFRFTPSLLFNILLKDIKAENVKNQEQLR